ncbi:MAG TPA: GAF domain-containing protein, partial [Actinomycetota bacterium]|nr:GAF domain-containing protein [Actinomycetota bacterium]
MAIGHSTPPRPDEAKREDALRHLAFVEELASLLTGDIDRATILNRVADLLVPALADWCWADILEADGSLRRGTIRCADPAKRSLAQAMEGFPPDRQGAHPAGTVLAAGRALLLTEVTGEVRARIARSDEHRRIIDAIDPRSAIMAPLRSGDRDYGMLVLVSAESGRVYTESDVSLIESVAARAANAVYNAQLFADVRSAEERHRKLVGSLDAIVWEAETSPFRFTFVSERTESILGYTSAEWFVEGFWETIIHPEDRQRVFAVSGTETSLGRDHEIEYRVIAADGRIVWLRDNVYVETDEHGRARTVRGLAIDITDRKLRERYENAQIAVDRTLAHTATLDELPRRLLQTLCDTLHWEVGSLWTVDQQTDKLRCSEIWVAPGIDVRGFRDLTMRLSLAKGFGLPGVVYESGEPVWIDDVATDRSFPRAPMAAAEGLHSGIGFPVVSGGTVLGVVEFFTTQVLSRDRELMQLMSTIGAQLGQFIERTRIQEALRESEARHRTVLESALDSVVMMDGEGRLLEFSPAAERTFGYRREDVIGRPVADLLVPASLREAHRRGLARYISTSEGRILNRRLEFPAMRADGSEIPVELTVVRVDMPGPPLFTGYIRDISGRVTADRRRDAHYQVTRALAEALSLEEAAQRILDALSRSLDWSVAVLWRVDEQAGVLRSVEAWTESQHFAELRDEVMSQTLSVGTSLPGRSWALREPSWSAIDEEVRATAPRAALPSALGLRGWHAFPVGNGNRIYAVIECFTKRKDAPDADLQAMLASIGSQLSQFIVRRRAEDELRYQQALLRSQSEATLDGVCVVSPEGGIVGFNQRFLDLWQVPHELAGQPTNEKLAEYILSQHADPDVFLQRAIRLHADQNAEDRHELELLDGRTFDWYSAPLRGDDGTLYGRAYYYRDITDRKRAERALADSTQRFAFLAEASTILGASLDHEETLRNIASLAVPFLADWCVIDLLDQQGKAQRIAVNHRVPSDELLRTAIESRTHYDLDPDAKRGVPKVLRTGISELEPDIREEWLEEAAGPEREYLDVIKALGFRSYMCVPLVARNVILGAITFISAESGRRYTPADLALAEDLARRAALAVDNARLYADSEHVATTLQQSLLPPTLPEIPGVDVAARYKAAARGVAVGGDFYDLFDIGDEWAVVIGDVCGKG